MTNKKYSKQMGWYKNQHQTELEYLSEQHEQRVQRLDTYKVEDLEQELEIRLFQLKLKKLEMEILQQKVKNAKQLLKLKDYCGNCGICCKCWDCGCQEKIVN